VWTTRSLGVVLHPTSLPDGRLGESAYAFVDWLAAAGVSWWQVLPLHPPDRYGSPYSSSSAFAGSRTLLADPDAPVDADEVAELRNRSRYWLPDWERFSDPGAAAAEVRFQREWGALRAYASDRGVGLVGDVPIYVAQGSCEHLGHRALFLPGGVAGAPPDDINPDGQHWGNPLYDWDALAATGYTWWIERLRHELTLVDAFRIDHFRGFAAFWAVPDGALTASDGAWLPGPGAALFRAAEAELGPLPVIAENLGVITPDVEQLRRELGYPGMAVMLWALGGPDDNMHRLDNHVENQVVYTSTHDTETLAGHFPERDPWELVQLALGSPAELAMLPVQDILGLGNEARFNRPGTLAGNWRWQLAPGQLTPAHAKRLREASATAGRTHASPRST
jgi:4-alpha-glucanotransferase